MSIFRTCITLALSISLISLSGCGAIEKNVEKYEKVQTKYTSTITRVIDGDTIAVEPTETLPQTNKDKKNPEHVIRLIGINAPEMNVRKKEPAECGAKEATEFLGENLPKGTEVNLEFDSNSEHTDTYGRSLAYVSSPLIADHAQNMIEHGLAVPYYPQSAPKPKNFDHYQELTDKARQYDLGNYASCPDFGKDKE